MRLLTLTADNGDDEGNESKKRPDLLHHVTGDVAAAWQKATSCRFDRRQQELPLPPLHQSGSWACFPRLPHVSKSGQQDVCSRASAGRRGQEPRIHSANQQKTINKMIDDRFITGTQFLSRRPCLSSSHDKRSQKKVPLLLLFPALSLFFFRARCVITLRRTKERVWGLINSCLMHQANVSWDTRSDSAERDTTATRSLTPSLGSLTSVCVSPTDR